MARKRKAVNRGRFTKRHKPNTSADVVESNDAGKTGPVMSPASAGAKRSRSTRNTPRTSSAQDRWGEQRLLTSKKSPLIDLDLVKLLAHPDAWNCLDEEEKTEIINLLPEDVRPEIVTAPSQEKDESEVEGEEGGGKVEIQSAKIAPPPESFLRYSNNWRDGVRQFQLDLQNGRYDREWLRQAQEAMRERAEGRFDDFKEREFEQFWGQKQKLVHSVIAGESSRVKLETLIQEGLVRKGDVWKMSRVFALGREKILVEKEARILDVDVQHLRFVMPPGQRVFLPHMHSTAVADKPHQQEDATAKTNGHATDDTDMLAEEHTKVAESDSDISMAQSESKEEEDAPLRPVSTDMPNDIAGAIDSQVLADDNQAEALISQSIEGSSESQQIASSEEQETAHNDTPITAKPSQDTVLDQTASLTSSHSRLHLPETSTDEDLIETIVPVPSGPGRLVKKVLEVDGRIANPPNGNAWKEIRCYRNNQDMGSLWEVRQAWFLKGK